MVKQCDICFENINKKNNEVICIHCEFSSCSTCCKKYILGSVNDAKCMKCSKTWSRDFLIDNFAYAFINNAYKKHREQVIFEKQMSMMAETQKEIEKENKIEEIDNLILEQKRQISKIYTKISDLCREKFAVQHGKPKTHEEVNKFYGHCPKDNCRGFITASWTCGICKTKVCKSCKEELGENEEVEEIAEEGAVGATAKNAITLIDDELDSGDFMLEDRPKVGADLRSDQSKTQPKDGSRKKHVCDPNLLESLSKIKKDSKPCPKCKSMIYRIEGCAQMHCTVCRTNYNWQTGEIITRGTFHNPHYIEWQRTHGGVAFQQNDCNGDIFEEIQIYALERAMVCDIYKKRFVIEFIRFMYHVYDIELYNYRNNNEEDCFLKLRISYLRNRITEEEFKKKLQQYEKREDKKNEIALIFDMMYNTGKSIILQLVLEDRPLVGADQRSDRVMKKKVNEVDIVESIKQINELIEYTNESMRKVSSKYKNKAPIVNLPKNQDARGTFIII